MVKNLKMARFKFPLMLLTVLVCSFLFFAFESTQITKRDRLRTDPQMVFIPGGAYYMGASDEQIDKSQVNFKKVVSVQSFWMDRTEVTNGQYRKFVNYVADSMKYLVLYTSTKNLAQSDPEDTLHVNWKNIAQVNKSLPKALSEFQKYRSNKNTPSIPASAKLINDLNPLWVPDVNRKRPNEFAIDPKKLVYRYNIIDYKKAARESNSSNGLDLDLGNYIIPVEVKVAPDTLVWNRDFSYSYFDIEVIKYFSSKQYNDYPVVGVNWKQAIAFCNWRTEHNDYYQGKPGKTDLNIDGIYRLPTEAEWEYAARGNSKINAMYPWGAPYARTKEGLMMANFKYGRGDYFAGDTKKDAPTKKVKSYVENGFGLFDMSGNVAEWTSSVYSPSTQIYMTASNPDIQAEVDDDSPLAKKSIRGGSWKDIAYYCQVSTRGYEYQSNAKSYIGFRCVLSMTR
jgi:formylglycine-generating enzyme required for sulfatase activity